MLIQMPLVAILLVWIRVVVVAVDGVVIVEVVGVELEVVVVVVAVAGRIHPLRSWVQFDPYNIP